MKGCILHTCNNIFKITIQMTSFEINMLLLFLIGNVVPIGSSTLSNTKAEELYNYIVNATNKDIPPCIGCGSALPIDVTFHLTSLNYLDEVNGEMNSIGYLTVSWIDDRIAWNPTLYANITSMMMPMDKVWTPTLMVGNPSKKISTMNGEIVLVRVVYNGAMIWNPGEVFLTKCYPDIYRYPYDAQECYISVVPWGALASEIILTCSTGIVVTPHYVNNGEWVLIEERLKANAYVEDRLSVVKFIFTYQRRPQFFIVNVILPIVLLSYLNCLVYLIPYQSGERVSYSITVLLSFAVFMTLVSDNIPKTSDPMSLLCYYLISVFTGSTFVMVSTIFNMMIFYRDPSFPVTSRYQLLIKLTSKRHTNQQKVEPSTSSATLVTVLGLDKTGGEIEKHHKDPLNDPIAEEIKRMEKEDELHKDVTWKDASKALDTISLFGFVFYFTFSTVVQLLFISIPSSGSAFST